MTKYLDGDLGSIPSQDQLFTIQLLTYSACIN